MKPVLSFTLLGRGSDVPRGAPPGPAGDPGLQGSGPSSRSSAPPTPRGPFHRLEPVWPRLASGPCAEQALRGTCQPPRPGPCWTPGSCGARAGSESVRSPSRSAADPPGLFLGGGAGICVFLTLIWPCPREKTNGRRHPVCKEGVWLLQVARLENLGRCRPRAKRGVCRGAAPRGLGNPRSL